MFKVYRMFESSKLESKCLYAESDLVHQLVTFSHGTFNEIECTLILRAIDYCKGLICV